METVAIRYFECPWSGRPMVEEATRDGSLIVKPLQD